jgi:hypothetical protein
VNAMNSLKVSLRPGSRWGKALSRLRPGERRDFLFLAALAETDSAGDRRLAERLAVIGQDDQALRLAAAGR